MASRPDGGDRGAGRGGGPGRLLVRRGEARGLPDARDDHGREYSFGDGHGRAVPRAELRSEPEPRHRRHRHRHTANAWRFAPTSEATLVAVTRSGGITGKASTLIIREDGSFLRLDAKAATVDHDTLPAASLAKLRTALQEADFPHLPRISKPDRPAIDAFTYAFRHAGYEVAADQTTLPQPLQKVLAALPPFEPR